MSIRKEKEGKEEGEGKERDEGGEGKEVGEEGERKGNEAKETDASNVTMYGP
jgi:hypothetical protein